MYFGGRITCVHVQAVEQVLRRMLPVQGAAKRGHAASTQDLWTAVRGAAAPFISAHADKFSDNLLHFLAFRGTLNAWDNAYLQQQVQAQRKSARHDRNEYSSHAGGHERITVRQSTDQADIG